jgi:hypothetical protein
MVLEKSFFIIKKVHVYKKNGLGNAHPFLLERNYFCDSSCHLLTINGNYAWNIGIRARWHTNRHGYSLVGGVGLDEVEVSKLIETKPSLENVAPDTRV